MENPQQPQIAELRLRAPKPTADSPVIYSNYAQASLSPHDLTMHFSWYTIPILEAPPTGPIDIQVRGPLVSVTIPLNLVRPLIRVLESQAAAYEMSTGQELPAEPPVSPVTADRPSQ